MHRDRLWIAFHALSAQTVSISLTGTFERTPQRQSRAETLRSLFSSRVSGGKTHWFRRQTIRPTEADSVCHGFRTLLLYTCGHKRFDHAVCRGWHTDRYLRSEHTVFCADIYYLDVLPFIYVATKWPGCFCQSEKPLLQLSESQNRSVILGGVAAS